MLNPAAHTAKVIVEYAYATRYSQLIFLRVAQLREVHALELRPNRRGEVNPTRRNA